MQATGDRTTRRNDWAISFLNFLLPPTCSVCDRPTKSESLCFDCKPKKINKELSCVYCGSWNEPSISKSCYFCLISPFSAREIRSRSHYDKRTRKLIKKLKYSEKTVLAKDIAELLSDSISLFTKKDWDLVLALPSSKKALQKRGFSHMHHVLRAFCKTNNLAFSYTALKNTSKNNYQSLTPLNKRMSNVKSAFCVKQKLVDKRRVLLLDDVITSGASQEAACLELLRAGAKSIDVLSLARSANFSKNRLKLI